MGHPERAELVACGFNVGGGDRSLNLPTPTQPPPLRGREVDLNAVDVRRQASGGHDVLRRRIPRPIHKLAMLDVPESQPSRKLLETLNAYPRP